MAGSSRRASRTASTTSTITATGLPTSGSTRPGGALPARDRAGRDAAEHWTEVLPHREQVMLEGFDLFRGHLWCSSASDGLPQIGVTDLRDAAPRTA